MTIRTRHSKDEMMMDAPGTGDILIRVSQHQLELIAAVLFVTKLGPRPYEQAALEMMSTIEDVFCDDPDAIANAFINVGADIDIVDDFGNVLNTLSADNIVIRV
jgi:hypothetical protein